MERIEYRGARMEGSRLILGVGGVFKFGYSGPLLSSPVVGMAVESL